MTRPKPIAERFWPKVRITPACWEWTATHNGRGYGYIGRGAAGAGCHLAHRLSWELHNGPIPDGLVVRHKCDNPPCVNPDHLELGTQADNARDQVERGRSPKGERNPNAKVTADLVREIRAATGSQESIGARFGLSQTQVGAIRRRTRWRHVA